MWFYYRVMSPNDADGMANSVDPDQTAPSRGAVWSGSALFAQAYLSENLGSWLFMIFTERENFRANILYLLWNLQNGHQSFFGQNDIHPWNLVHE